MAKIKLAEALLRRKELQGKVDTLKEINVKGLFETKMTRKNVTDNVDDIIAQVPIIKIEQVTACFDWHSRRLRLVDAAIQQANWTTEIDIEDSVLSDYKE
ncbi:MAG: hypothetical protein GY821_12895 [Gammaproteobacteria bacterium]|nr:hypothetical protein [Gammaproteobacteria bacterium]